MPIALLMLIEQLVLSPAVQTEAWNLIKPYVQTGTMPSDQQLWLAQTVAAEAHAAVVGNS